MTVPDLGAGVGVGWGGWREAGEAHNSSEYLVALQINIHEIPLGPKHCLVLSLHLMPRWLFCGSGKQNGVVGEAHHLRV